MLDLKPQGVRLVPCIQHPPTCTGGRELTPLLFLPVHQGKVVNWFSVIATLHKETFVADSDIQGIALIGAILNRCPLLSPDIDVFALVVLTVLPLTESA